jgi:hypothetical protein
MYVVSVDGRLCVLAEEIGCPEFWPFCVDTDAMRVYVVGADGHVSFCLDFLLFFSVLRWLIGRVVICCSLLISFRSSEVCLWRCFRFYGKNGSM